MGDAGTGESHCYLGPYCYNEAFSKVSLIKTAPCCGLSDPPLEVDKGPQGDTHSMLEVHGHAHAQLHLLGGDAQLFTQLLSEGQ